MICKEHIKYLISITAVFFVVGTLYATNYTVNTKANLQTKMVAANPGDTIIVTNGTYNNWGAISFANTKGTSTSAWIVLRAETLNGVVFTGNVSLSFSGKKILVSGFKFANGSASATDVIQFRTTSSALASYCRATNITINDFNSDSTGSVNGGSPDIDNKWISIYGTNNRVDHCTFINKFNAGATVVVWYDNTTYPQQSTPTYHKIDSNYFNGRGYQGSNGGESMRIGVSSTSRTNGFNIIEYNLFENCAQVEPEIISNKSNFNTYRYNTFKNCNGGLTLRHGRYCNVYGNYFIVDNIIFSKSYGVRVIDKGHRIFNNYFEGLLGNKNSVTSLRCPIILYNGLASTNDTTDASKAAGYFPADSAIIAFNTIVNCSGGAGIVLGFTDGGANTFQPKGIKVANNLIKMTTGQVGYKDAANTTLTYVAEGNIYNAPSFGLSSSGGFTSKSLTFGTRTSGFLLPPSNAQDAAVNSVFYSGLLNSLDATGQTRSNIFDVGCKELNGTGSLIASPLDSTVVGAGKPVIVTPVSLVAFSATQTSNAINLKWFVENEINFLQYEVEYSHNGIDFKTAGIVIAEQKPYYYYTINNSNGKAYFRLKLVDRNSKFIYSNIIAVAATTTINVYPNPAKDVINIYLKNVNSSIILKVIDDNGKNIRKVYAVSNSISIPTTNMASGMYHIQVIENNQLINTHKVIVSK